MYNINHSDDHNDGKTTDINMYNMKSEKQKSKNMPSIEIYERELEKGWIYLTKQFLWPTIDFDIILKQNFSDKIDAETIKSKISQVIYPARLYGAVYLGLMFILGVFYANSKIVESLNQTAFAIQQGYIEIQTSTLTDLSNLSKGNVTEEDVLRAIENFDYLSDVYV